MRERHSAAVVRVVALAELLGMPAGAGLIALGDRLTVEYAARDWLAGAEESTRKKKERLAETQIVPLRGGQGGGNVRTKAGRGLAWAPTSTPATTSAA